MTIRCFWLITTPLLATSCAAPPAEQHQEETTWVSYEPAVTELAGTLSVVDRYGPPNFGETPDIDQELRVPILILDRPVSVRGDASSQANSDTISHVREIQLIFVGGGSEYEDYVSKHIVVTGRLLQRVSGHHFTDVVMTTATIVRGQR